MPATNDTEVVEYGPADLQDLETKLQDLLYDQHQDTRDLRRIKQVMAQRAKIIASLSDEIERLQAEADVDL
jgi:hypothetical protein